MGKSQEKDVSCVNECHRSLSKMIACVEQSREILILILIDFIIFLLLIYIHTLILEYVDRFINGY